MTSWKNKLAFIGLALVIIGAVGVALIFGYTASGQAPIFKDNLTITTADNTSLIYNGQNQTIEVTDCIISEGELAPGDSFFYEPHSYTIFDAGEYTNTVDYKILNANAEDVTSSYNIKEEFGITEVKKRSLKFSLNLDLYKPEDVPSSGVILDGAYFNIEGDGLAPTDTIEVKVSKNYVSEDGNTYQFKYEITKVFNNSLRRNVTNNYSTPIEINFQNRPPFVPPELPDDLPTPDIDPDINDEILDSLTFDGSREQTIGQMPGAGSDVPVFKFQSSQAGIFYFRGKSYGDYNGSGFSNAVAYTKDVDPNEFMSNFYPENNLAKMKITYSDTVKANDYDLLPYFYQGSFDTSDDIYSKMPTSENNDYTFNFYNNIDHLYDLSKLDSLVYSGSDYNKFTNDEAEYSSFVEQNYLNVNSRIKSALSNFIVSHNIDTSNIASFYRDLQKVFNSDEFEYDLKPYSDPSTDNVLTFLTSVKVGNCQNYAASAVLLFRTLGIPARFTEGFIGIAKEPNTEYVVTALTAHAWCEIYINGKGWVQVELTPFGEALDDLLNGTGGQNNEEDEDESTPDENATTIKSQVNHTFNSSNINNDYLFDVNVNSPGLYYLREESYGDFSGEGFDGGIIYNVDENINPNSFVSNQLSVNNYQTNSLTIEYPDSSREKELTANYFYDSDPVLNANNDIYYRRNGNGINEINETVFNYDYLDNPDLLMSLRFLDSEYTKAEKLYNKFVNKNYLNVDSGIKLAIISAITKYVGYVPESAQVILPIIADYLSESNIIYNPYVDYKLDVDSIIKNVVDHGEITCSSEAIASIATLLLRSLGIPTRLVRGYLYNATTVGSSAISNTNEYYWNEVYFEGHGWIRVDLTKASGHLDLKYYGNKKKLQVKSDSTIIDYSGDSYKPNFYIDNEEDVDDSDYILLTSSSSFQNVGTYSSSCSFEAFDQNNGRSDVSYKYALVYDFGTITIQKRSITISTDTISEPYEYGKKIYASINNVSNLDQEKFTLVYDRKSLSTIGSCSAEISVTAILDKNGNNVIDNFSISYIYGTLTLY